MIKILVIEDETNLRENIISMLTYEHFMPLGAPDGVVGVALAQEHKPDLIVCDIMMPRLDGYGVLMELQSDTATASIPFLFLTAKADKADIRRGMDLGADDYLTKPFSNKELLDAIHARLQKQEMVVHQYEQKLDDLRESIALNLPHELRTPLTAILGYSAYLVDEVGSLEREQIFTMSKGIYRSARRLQHLVENYLMYAQLEFVKFNPETVRTLQEHHIAHPVFPIDAIEWIAREKADTVSRAKDLILDLKDISVQIPEDDIKKIAEELIDNAFKFSDEGTPVHVGMYDQNGVYGLVVHDKGRGMEQSQIDSIGAYVQFDRKIYEQQGAGLGLIIVKRLTELYKGDMSIQSQRGTGTTVDVVFRRV